MEETVNKLGPVFLYPGQILQCADIQFLQKIGLPVIPEPRIHRGHVGISNQIDRPQILGVADGIGEGRNYARVAGFPCQRHPRHENMVPDKKFYPLSLFDIQVKPLHYVLQAFVSLLLMVSACRLAYVMEEKHHKEDFGVLHFVNHVAEIFEPAVFRVLQFLKMPYSHESMFINSIHVVWFTNDEQPQCPEFRKKPPEDTRFIHLIQRFVNVFALEDLQETPHHFGRASGHIVYSNKAGPDLVSQSPAEPLARSRTQTETLHDLAGAEPGGKAFGRYQPSTRDGKTLRNLSDKKVPSASHKGPAAHYHDLLRKFPDNFALQIVVAEKSFVGAEFPGVTEPQKGRHAALVFEGQYIIPPSAFQMQTEPGSKQEITGVCETPALIGIKKPEEALKVLHLQHHLRKPVSGMNVPEPSFTFFDVGLQKVQRLAGIQVSLLHLPQLVPYEFLPPLVCDGRIHPCPESVKEPSVTGNIARFQQ